MFTHFIALSKLSDIEIAYHFSSDTTDEIISVRDKFMDRSVSISDAAYSIHALKTDSPSFESVKKMDPYFTDVKPFNSVDGFLDQVRELSQLNSIDVASYLIRHYEIRPFSLQKTLYYIYADQLVDGDKRLFISNFVAFDQGPVDQEVYRYNKHDHDSLLRQHELEKKLIISGKIDKIEAIIDSGVHKYNQYFDSLWGDPEDNPTHRQGSPWSIARDHGGQNAPILDKYILKAHHVEQI